MVLDRRLSASHPRWMTEQNQACFGLASIMTTNGALLKKKGLPDKTTTDRVVVAGVIWTGYLLSGIAAAGCIDPDSLPLFVFWRFT
jgi:hypothetical protein